MSAAERQAPPTGWRAFGLSIEHALNRGEDPALLFDENSPIRDELRRLLAASAPVLAWPIKGVRVEGDAVIVEAKGGNDAARWLCGAILDRKHAMELTEQQVEQAVDAWFSFVGKADAHDFMGRMRLAIEASMGMPRISSGEAEASA
jgi:hypothetical protein